MDRRQFIPCLPWKSLRTRATSDDTALTTWEFSSWPSANTFKLSDLQWPEEVRIAFYGTDAADENLTSYILYGRPNLSGPLLNLATGVVTLGARACVVDPITAAAITNGLWADTITVTSGIVKTLNDVIAKYIQNSGGDQIASLIVPVRHVAELYLELDLNTCASMGAIITAN